MKAIVVLFIQCKNVQALLRVEGLWDCWREWCVAADALLLAEGLGEWQRDNLRLSFASGIHFSLEQVCCNKSSATTRLLPHTSWWSVTLLVINKRNVWQPRKSYSSCGIIVSLFYGAHMFLWLVFQPFLVIPFSNKILFSLQRYYML